MASLWRGGFPLAETPVEGTPAWSFGGGGAAAGSLGETNEKAQEEKAMIVNELDELRERLSAFQKRRFCVAMSGHRNVLPSVVEAVKQGTWEALECLRKTTGKPLCVLCGLAVGADQIVAEAVLRNRESVGTSGSSESLDSRDVLVAVLPMPRAIYEEDFERDDVVEFARLAERADAVFELALNPEGAQWLETHPGERLPSELRMLQYELLGEALAQVGEGLLALWDGIPVKCDADGRTVFWERGGTADVVRKFLEIQGQRLPKEQSPRVVHVAVPRTKKGQVRFAAGLETGEVRELGRDEKPSRGETSTK